MSKAGDDPGHEGVAHAVDQRRLAGPMEHCRRQDAGDDGQSQHQLPRWAAMLRREARKHW